MAEGIEIDWGGSELIPEGEYNAVYVSHTTSNGSFGPKVKITFRIVSMGPQFEKLIDAWYNLKAVGGKSKKNGRIQLSRHSKLTLELMRIFHMKKRIDRISPSMLKGHITVIKVRTVTQNSTQKHLPEVLRYSTVDSMVCLLTFSDISEAPLVKPELTPEPTPTKKPLEAIQN
jgi:hypothetical protein